MSKKVKKKKKLTLMQRRAIVGLLFISPWLIGFLYFYLRSVIMTINFSLSEITINLTGGYSTEFIGLDNYTYLFNAHGSFKETFGNSLVDIIIDVPLIVFFSLFMAIMLNQKFKGRTIVRAIFFLPVILNSEAISAAITLSEASVVGGLSPASSAMMESIGSGSSGANLDYYIQLFENLAMPASLLDYVVGAVTRINSIITASGVQIVIFIAALQSVPSSLYEVAKIEGATPYETFWKITFPMVMPLIITNTVYTLVEAFSGSSVIQLAYDTAFGNEMNYALSSAITLLSTIVVCGLLLIVCRWMSKRTFYQN